MESSRSSSNVSSLVFFVLLLFVILIQWRVNLTKLSVLQKIFAVVCLRVSHRPYQSNADHVSTTNRQVFCRKSAEHLLRSANKVDAVRAVNIREY